MAASSLLVVCILVTCSVWRVHGRSLELSIDDQEQVQISVSEMAAAHKLPGVCWVCKWALKRVKKEVGRNGTAENLKSKLKSSCDAVGLLKYLCRKFVSKHLGELIEELSTTDDVRTICVNTGACPPKELLNLPFYPIEEDSPIKIYN